MTLSWCVFFSFIAYFFHSKSNFVNMIDLDAHLTWAQTKRFWKQTSSFIGRQSQEISLEFEINLVKIHHIKKNWPTKNENKSKIHRQWHSLHFWVVKHRKLDFMMIESHKRAAIHHQSNFRIYFCECVFSFTTINKVAWRSSQKRSIHNLSIFVIRLALLNCFLSNFLSSLDHSIICCYWF